MTNATADHNSIDQVNDNEKAQWLASDYDDPLEVAIVYNKVDNTDGSSGEDKSDATAKCGHALRW